MTAVRRWCGSVGILVILATAASGAGPGSEGGWINLLNGKDMSGWKLQNPKGTNGWRVQDGVTINQTPSTNIISDQWFRDFELQCEYQIPKGSNAGIYMLNRYEIQIFDDWQKPVYSHMCGSLYGEITPTANACKPPAAAFPNIKDDEWQTFDIKLQAARWNAAGEKTDNVRVTVIHNGKTIIDNQELKTPTGAARRYDEEAPGPIVLQGDHGPVAFRQFRIRGQAYEAPDPKAPGPAVIGLAAKPKELADNKAAGVALEWFTPDHAYGSAYRVYRGDSADFALDRAHLIATAPKRAYEDCDFERDGACFYRIEALGAGTVAGRPCAPLSIAGKANQVATSDLAAASWARIEGENKPSRKTAKSRPPVMQKQKFNSGIGVQGTTLIKMYVGKLVGDSKDCRFRATVGLDDSVASRIRDTAALRFVVELDGKKVFDSGRMKWADGGKTVDVPIPAGSRQLVLRTMREGARSGDNGDWAEPRIEKTAP